MLIFRREEIRIWRANSTFLSNFCMRIADNYGMKTMKCVLSSKLGRRLTKEDSCLLR
jgi:hypothetical protein